MLYWSYILTGLVGDQDPEDTTGKQLFLFCFSFFTADPFKLLWDVMFSKHNSRGPAEFHELFHWSSHINFIVKALKIPIPPHVKVTISYSI